MTDLPRLSQNPTDPAFVQDPYPFYDRVRALAPLVHWEDYGLPVAAGHNGVMALLKDRRFGRERPAIEDPPSHLRPFYALEAHSMLELEPPRHTRLRKLALRAFTSRRVAALDPGIAALCHDLIDRFPEGAFDLLDALARPLPVITIARLLGVPVSMSDQLLAWSNAMVAMYQARRDEDLERRAGAAAAEFTAFLREHVEHRRTRPADDLITELIAAEEDGSRLSTDELIATCVLLLNAGHEATVHTLGNGVKALLEHGISLDGQDSTVEEVLRFDPPLHLFTRIAREDVTVFGHSFRAGDEVGCLLAAANRDPDVWPDATRFDPARAPTTHAAFGAGLHFCLGAPLARLEIRLALQILGQRCPRMALAEPPRYANLYHFHGLERLLVTR